MNRQKIILLVTVLALIAGTAGILTRYRGSQKLGQPGVKTRALPGTANLEVVLPEKVLEYPSEARPQDQVVLDTLPKDTSFGQRIYQSADGTGYQLNVVLMGADRTSLHKPQICMPGQGFTINRTEAASIPISEPHPYELPVIRLLVARENSGVPGDFTHGMFIYWFVADGDLSADVSALRRMWLSTKNLLLTGKLQRWAYVTCFTYYPPGGEAACFDRVKRFLAAAVPQFQTTTLPGRTNPTPGANH